MDQESTNNSGGWLSSTVLMICALLVMATSPVRAQDRAGPAANAQASAGPVYIMGLITVKPDRVQDFIALVSKMKDRVRTEDHGNLQYELFTAQAMGSAAPQSATFVFLEGWRDQASAAAHAKWAGPIVRSSWKDMSETMQLMRLSQLPLLKAP